MDERRIRLNNLCKEMIEFNNGDPARIQHFIKVHSFAKLIGEMECIDEETLYILEGAAYVHDIGIRPAEQQYGSCNGKLQEQVGPAFAKEMLEKLGFEEEVIARICYLVAHHHTYTNVDGMDYQILLEADFLVNLYEDGVNDKAVYSSLECIFKTDSGRMICETMFGMKK